MKLSKLIGVFMAIAVLFGAAAVAHADSLCKNVKFEFKNNHKEGEKIIVKKVEYFDKEDNKWRTENVKNVTCAHGNTCVTGGDGLEYVGNEDIVKIKFQYTYFTSGGTGWATTSAVKKPENPYCKADKTFRKSPGQPFVIFGVEHSL